MTTSMSNSVTEKDNLLELTQLQKEEANKKQKRKILVVALSSIAAGGIGLGSLILSTYPTIEGICSVIEWNEGNYTSNSGLPISMFSIGSILAGGGILCCITSAAVPIIFCYCNKKKKA